MQQYQPKRTRGRNQPGGIIALEIDNVILDISHQEAVKAPIKNYHLLLPILQLAEQMNWKVAIVTARSSESDSDLRRNAGYTVQQIQAYFKALNVPIDDNNIFFCGGIRPVRRGKTRNNKYYNYRDAAAEMQAALRASNTTAIRVVATEEPGNGLENEAIRQNSPRLFAYATLQKKYGLPDLNCVFVNNDSRENDIDNSNLSLHYHFLTAPRTWQFQTLFLDNLYGAIGLADARLEALQNNSKEELAIPAKNTQYAFDRYYHDAATEPPAAVFIPTHRKQNVINHLHYQIEPDKKHTRLNQIVWRKGQPSIEFIKEILFTDEFFERVPSQGTGLRQFIIRPNWHKLKKRLRESNQRGIGKAYDNNYIAQLIDDANLHTNYNENADRYNNALHQLYQVFIIGNPVQGIKKNSYKAGIWLAIAARHPYLTKQHNIDAWFMLGKHFEKVIGNNELALLCYQQAYIDRQHTDYETDTEKRLSLQLRIITVWQPRWNNQDEIKRAIAWLEKNRDGRDVDLFSNAIAELYGKTNDPAKHQFQLQILIQRATETAKTGEITETSVAEIFALAEFYDPSLKKKLNPFQKKNKNLKVANLWRQVAIAPDSIGLCKLAMLYEAGEEVQRNLGIAKDLYLLAEKDLDTRDLIFTSKNGRTPNVNEIKHYQYRLHALHRLVTFFCHNFEDGGVELKVVQEENHGNYINNLEQQAQISRSSDTDMRTDSEERPKPLPVPAYDIDLGYALHVDKRRLERNTNKAIVRLLKLATQNYDMALACYAICSLYNYAQLATLDVAQHFMKLFRLISSSDLFLDMFDHRPGSADIYCIQGVDKILMGVAGYFYRSTRRIGDKYDASGFEKAEIILKAMIAAQHHSDQARILLALIYFEGGHGVKKDIERGLRLLEDTILNRNSDCNDCVALLGYLYQQPSTAKLPDLTPLFSMQAEEDTDIGFEEETEISASDQGSEEEEAQEGVSAKPRSRLDDIERGEISSNQIKAQKTLERLNAFLKDRPLGFALFVASLFRYPPKNYETIAEEYILQITQASQTGNLRHFTSNNYLKLNFLNAACELLETINVTSAYIQTHTLPFDESSAPFQALSALYGDIYNYNLAEIEDEDEGEDEEEVATINSGSSLKKAENYILARRNAHERDLETQKPFIHNLKAHPIEIFLDAEHDKATRAMQIGKRMADPIAQEQYIFSALQRFERALKYAVKLYRQLLDRERDISNDISKQPNNFSDPQEEVASLDSRDIMQWYRLIPNLNERRKILGQHCQQLEAIWNNLKHQLKEASKAKLIRYNQLDKFIRTTGTNDDDGGPLPDPDLINWLTHPYTDEEINHLFESYLSGIPHIGWTSGVLGTDAAMGYNVLAESLRAFTRNTRQTQIQNYNAITELLEGDDSDDEGITTVFVPVNLYNDYHWILVIINYENPTDQVPSAIQYCDPLGGEINNDIENALWDFILDARSLDRESSRRGSTINNSSDSSDSDIEVLDEENDSEFLKDISITPIPIRLQYELNSCGAWIVEIARSVANNKAYPTEGHDINIARQEHYQILNSTNDDILDMLDIIIDETSEGHPVNERRQRKQKGKEKINVHDSEDEGAGVDVDIDENQRRESLLILTAEGTEAENSDSELDFEEEQQALPLSPCNQTYYTILASNAGNMVALVRTHSVLMKGILTTQQINLLESEIERAHNDYEAFRYSRRATELASNTISVTTRTDEESTDTSLDEGTPLLSFPAVSSTSHDTFTYLPQINKVPKTPKQKQQKEEARKQELLRIKDNYRIPPKYDQIGDQLSEVIFDIKKFENAIERLGNHPWLFVPAKNLRGKSEITGKAKKQKYHGFSAPLNTELLKELEKLGIEFGLSFLRKWLVRNPKIAQMLGGAITVGGFILGQAGGIGTQQSTRPENLNSIPALDVNDTVANVENLGVGAQSNARRFAEGNNYNASNVSLANDVFNYLLVIVLILVCAMLAFLIIALAVAGLSKLREKCRYPSKNFPEKPEEEHDDFVVFNNHRWLVDYNAVSQYLREQLLNDMPNIKKLLYRSDDKWTGKNTTFRPGKGTAASGKDKTQKEQTHAPIGTTDYQDLERKINRLERYLSQLGDSSQHLPEDVTQGLVVSNSDEENLGSNISESTQSSDEEAAQVQQASKLRQQAGWKKPSSTRLSRDGSFFAHRQRPSSRTISDWRSHPLRPARDRGRLPVPEGEMGEYEQLCQLNSLSDQSNNQLGCFHRPVSEGRIANPQQFVGVRQGIFQPAGNRDLATAQSQASTGSDTGEAGNNTLRRRNRMTN